MTETRTEYIVNTAPVYSDWLPPQEPDRIELVLVQVAKGDIDVREAARQLRRLSVIESEVIKAAQLMIDAQDAMDRPAAMRAEDRLSEWVNRLDGWTIGQQMGKDNGARLDIP
jgi:hypothetical protein